MWLTDLLPQSSETRPKSKNNVGRDESLVPITPSDTKTAGGSPPRVKGAEQSTFTQVLSKKPESVRHLPLEEGSAAPALPPWEEICPRYFEGCFSCRYYRNKRLLFFCAKFGGDGRLLQ
jgi:hypothetical protein